MAWMAIREFSCIVLQVPVPFELPGCTWDELDYIILKSYPKCPSELPLLSLLSSLSVTIQLYDCRLFCGLLPVVRLIPSLEIAGELLPGRQEINYGRLSPKVHFTSTH